MNNQAICYQISSYESNAMKSGNPFSGIGETDTSRTLDLNGENPACNQGGTMVVNNNELYQASSFGSYEASEGAGSLRASGGDLGGGSENIVVNALCADDYKGANRQYVDDRKLQVTDQYVRRLTPLECERLQGFPDGWTDIPGATDTKRYRALGNSIALPFWEHLAKRFVSIGEVKTIGSLFDGIGGFPLCFKEAGAETLWTSEIEPFCEDVVRYHYERGEL